jgi:hypothetical protein
MKNVLKIFLMILLLSMLMGCHSQDQQMDVKETGEDEELAKRVLTTFLDHLHAGEYEDAVELFGGSYAVPMDQNPDMDPDDHAALLHNGCMINGMQCLLPGKIELEETLADESYVFSVEFQKADGETFEMGPCCGDDAVEGSPQRLFLFTVQKNDQVSFVVMELPPYLP